ncbi:hypothetical protein NUACC21_34290 [Scytonema sp. NUACC21]
MKISSIFVSLIATIIFTSIGTVSYAQKPTKLVETNKMSQSQVNSNASSGVIEGFEVFCSNSTKDPYNIWASHSSFFLKNSIIEFSNEHDNIFKTYLGKCISYSVIDTIFLTEKTQVVYIESLHERSIVFWDFTVYKRAGRWLISAFNFNVDATAIIPISPVRNGKTH